MPVPRGQPGWLLQRTGRGRGGRLVSHPISCLYLLSVPVLEKVPHSCGTFYFPVVPVSPQNNVWFVESDGQERRIWKVNRNLKELFLLRSAEGDWGCPRKMSHDCTDTPVPTCPRTVGQQRASTAPPHPHAPALAARNPFHPHPPNALLGLPKQTCLLC